MRVVQVAGISLVFLAICLVTIAPKRRFLWDTNTGSLKQADVASGKDEKTLEMRLVHELVEAWTTMYGLNTSSPPKIVTPKIGWIKGQDYPLPPHLEDCESITQERENLDKRGVNGELPEWLHPDLPFRDAEPPWIRGGNKDNWGLTRLTQAILWEHQHPENCSDPKHIFAVMNWVKRDNHGIGSTLHVMGQAFGMAILNNRIFVPTPGTFQRASGSHCKGSDAGSINCYFFPSVSPECEKQAMKLLSEQENPFGTLDNDVRLSTSFPVVEIGEEEWQPYSYWHPNWTDDFWMRTPLKDPISIENLGIALKFFGHQLRDGFGPINVMSRQFLQVGWWRAQALRYMLRWPSRKLCHATNQARQEAYGIEVAKGVVNSVLRMELMEDVATNYSDLEVRRLRNIDLHTRPLALWKRSEPYIPRPIVSIHVRLSDKGGEMRLFSLSSHMWLAGRLRRHVPNIRRIWLTTEYQPVIDESKQFKNWKFYYTNNSRISQEIQPESDFFGEELGKLTMATFANLQITSQCDYFIGTLGSNWGRVINELRLTSGRLQSGYLSLNFDEI